jgi:flagellar protein FliS
MRNHGYQSYFDYGVFDASPLQLIDMLYAAALDSIAAARRHLRRKDILARSVAINRAFRMVTELSHCLNHEAGGELSARLKSIYAYVLRRLIQANCEQSEAPLVEAENLLNTLAGAWKACSPAVREAGFPNSEVIRPDGYLIHEPQATTP